MVLPLLKTAGITCICFLALVLLAGFLLSKKDVLFSLSSWQGYLWSGALWMISYTAAIRIEYWIVKSRLT
jgi:hypothetical protein